MNALLSAELAFPLAVIAKATLLLAAAGLLAAVLAWRRASAATRHLVWALAACGLLVLPFFSVTLPGWRLGLVRLPAAEPALGVLPPAYVAGPDAAPSVPLVPEVPSSLAPSVDAAAPAGESRTGPAGGLETGTLIVALYLLGTVALLGRLLLGRWGVRRLARGATELDDPAWTALLRDLAWMLDVDRPVRLLRSRHATMPMTWGVRRPAVLLPDEAAEWPEERRRVVLLHELAHVARYDCLTQTLAAVACALYWFHPGAWYAARRLRVERELACDDRVLSAGTRAREYAAHLLEVARAFRPVGLAEPVSVSMARPSHLEGRMLAVLDGLRSRRTLSRSAALGAAAAALVLVLPLAAMRPGEARVEAAPAAAAKPNAADPLAAFLAPPSQEPAQDGTFEREFSVRPGEQLTLDLQADADVTIEAWDRNTVHIRSQIYGPRVVRVEAERSGREVKVHTRLLRRDRLAEMRMTVRVPRRFDVDVFTAGGGVDIRGVTGNFTGTTQGGGLAFTRASGTVRMTTEGGGAAITDSELRGLLRTEGGGTVLSGNRGDLDIRTEGGATLHTSRSGQNTITTTHDDDGDDDVDYSSVDGQISVSKAGGQVILAGAPRGARVSTGGGQIRIGPAGGSVQASTGGGSIHLESVRGSVRANTGSGAVHVRLAGDGGDVEIRSGNGSVTLILPADFSGNLDVESAFTQSKGPTQVISDFPLTITQTNTWDGSRGTPRRYVRGRGRLGSGRHTVRINTVNGNVQVLRAGSRRATASSTTTTSQDVECGQNCTITINDVGQISGIGYVSTVGAGEGDGVGYGQSVGVGVGDEDEGGYAYTVGDEDGRVLAVRRMAENAPPAAAAQGAARLAFSDPSVRVQKAAVAALATLPEEHARPRLERISREHPNAEVRRAARDALRRDRSVTVNP